MSSHPGPADLPGAPGEPVALKLVLDTHPDCSTRLAEWGNALIHGGVLAPEEREFIVGCVIGLRPSPYVESGHRTIALAAGLPAAEFKRARGGTSADIAALSPRKRLLHRAVMELVETADLRTATRMALLETRDPRELLELMYVVSFYVLIASITTVYGLEPEPDAQGDLVGA